MNEKEKEEFVSKKELTDKKKVLKVVLVAIGLIFIFFLATLYFIDATKKFVYDDMDFDIVKSGSIKFYHTAFVVKNLNEDTKINYNVYLRNDPRELEKIEFLGYMNPQEAMVLNSSNNFNCGGKGVIAIANFNQIVNGAGMKVFRDENATCDAEARYMFVNLIEGNKTKIEQTGPACYNIEISNCEILEGTERFLVEILNSELND